MPTWHPRGDQRRAIDWLTVNRGGAIFADPGAGKTSITLEIMRRRHIPAGERALLLAPLATLKSTWVAETQKWNQFNGIRTSVLHGPKKRDALKAEADLYLMNYEGLSWLNHQGWRYTNQTVLIVDELSKFKHWSTQRMGIIKQLHPRFNYIYGLTGTPCDNSLMDLFGQLFVVDKGKTLGRFITPFRRQYFFEVNREFGKWAIIPGNEEKIHKAITPSVLRLEGVGLDLPKLSIVDIPVEMPPKAAAVYRELKKDLITEIDSQTVVVRNAGVLSGKLRQLAGGCIYTSKGCHNLVHQAKMDALQNLVDELQRKPLLVAYQYRHELAELRKIYPDAPTIGSGVSAKRVTEIVEDWNKGLHRLVFVHPLSGGYGLNMQEGGSHLAWYSLPWVPADYTQMMRRIWRPGQERRVFVYRLLTRGTVDHVVTRALAEKGAVQERLFDYLIEHLRKGD